MATPRKYLPDGSSPPKGRPKGMDTMAIYAKVPTESVQREPEPKRKSVRGKRAWAQKGYTKSAIKRIPGPKPKGESLEMKEAFEAYLTLGDDRSLPKLSQVLGKPLATLKEWCGKYGWVERVLHREEELTGSLSVEPAAIQLEKRKFGLALIDKILKNTVTLNADGSIMECTVEAKSPSDVRTLLILRDELLNPDKGSKTFGKGSQINAENAVFIIKK